MKFTYPSQHRAQTKLKETYLSLLNTQKSDFSSKLPWRLFNGNSSKAQIPPIG